ncbi:uncharacterized protein LOC126666248 [Mercurialis annua]|uniref:uncharacterized protein LOC126666248 n=1 Tax=Mercurialis annua TaxID=3986 RepID=UPI00215E54A2|nr:uncharacterized protein LOC126666248 [Mercurialis annua]
MYYIRKRAKYRPVNDLRITTTDCLFDDRMTSYYVAYLKRKKSESTSVSERSLIAKYICGYNMLCNTHWKNVDEVLFPMNMKKQKHWILGRLVFKERCIYVYNSMNSNVARKSAVEAATKYSVLIPLFLAQMNFYDLRSDIDLNSQPYLNKNSNEAFRIEVVEDLPTQKESDCGAFLLAFAEFLCLRKEIPCDFNIENYRERVAFLLFRYGNMKIESNIVSDEEVEKEVPNPKRKGKNKI